MDLESTTTVSSTQGIPSITLGSLEKIMDELNGLRIENKHKVYIVNKKQYKAFKKELKVKEIVNNGNSFSYYPLVTPDLIDVKFYVKPYIKKMRIIDMEAFNPLLFSFLRGGEE